MAGRRMTRLSGFILRTVPLSMARRHLRGMVPPLRAKLARSEAYGDCFPRANQRRTRGNPQAGDGHVRQLRPGIRLSAAGMPLLHARQMLDGRVLPVFSRCGAPAGTEIGGYFNGPGGSRAPYLRRLRQAFYPGRKTNVLFARLSEGRQPPQKQGKDAENAARSGEIALRFALKKACISAASRSRLEGARYHFIAAPLKS